jgi:hypothetical protein
MKIGGNYFNPVNCLNLKIKTRILKQHYTLVCMKKEKIKEISHEVIDFGESKGLTEKSQIGEWIDAAVEYMLKREQERKD